MSSIYERVGGAPAIGAAVDQFYIRLLADPMIAPFFATVQMAHQKEQQVKFMASALGGPQRYDGRSMWSAHRNLALEQKHFDRILFHLSNSLRALGVDEATIGNPMRLMLYCSKLCFSGKIAQTLMPLEAEVTNTATIPFVSRILVSLVMLFPVLLISSAFMFPSVMSALVLHLPGMCSLIT